MVHFCHLAPKISFLSAKLCAILAHRTQQKKGAYLAMKHSKRMGALVLSAVLCLSLTACGSNPKDSDDKQPTDGKDVTTSTQPSQDKKTVETASYTSPSGSFTVTIPTVEGGWTKSDGGNEEHLVLDNSDQSLSILIQALPKEQAQTQYPDLASLVEFYEQSTLSSLGDPTGEEITVPKAADVQAESFTATQNGTTAKAFVAFIEMEKGYYVYTITGTEKPYDANIQAQKDAISSLVEN